MGVIQALLGVAVKDLHGFARNDPKRWKKMQLGVACRWQSNLRPCIARKQRTLISQVSFVKRLASVKGCATKTLYLLSSQVAAASKEEAKGKAKGWLFGNWQNSCHIVKSTLTWDLIWNSAGKGKAKGKGKGQDLVAVDPVWSFLVKAINEIGAMILGEIKMTWETAYDQLSSTMIYVWYIWWCFVSPILVTALYNSWHGAIVERWNLTHLRRTPVINLQEKPSTTPAAMPEAPPSDKARLSCIGCMVRGRATPTTTFTRPH